MHLQSSQMFPPTPALTIALQELTGAVDRKQGIVQTSEVELQHSCYRVQIISSLRQWVLSCKGGEDTLSNIINSP